MTTTHQQTLGQICTTRLHPNSFSPEEALSFGSGPLLSACGSSVPSIDIRASVVVSLMLVVVGAMLAFDGVAEFPGARAQRENGDQL